MTDCKVADVPSDRIDCGRLGRSADGLRRRASGCAQTSLSLGRGETISL
jgi:hypothetical protein